MVFTHACAAQLPVLPPSIGHRAEVCLQPCCMAVAALQAAYLCSLQRLDAQLYAPRMTRATHDTMQPDAYSDVGDSQGERVLDLSQQAGMLAPCERLPG